MRTNAQASQILEHLQGGKSITPLEALYKFNCLRLGARIFDLRERYNIKTEMVEDGNKKYAKYTLVA